VGIQEICIQADCQKILCNKNDPACLKIMKRLASFNLTHSQTVNNKPTVELSDTDINGDAIKQYAYEFKNKPSLQPGEGKPDPKATNYWRANQHDVSHKIDEEIFNKQPNK
jgi:hypothetical protein